MILIRRAWGSLLNLFLVGDLLAAVFLPIWLGAGEDGVTEGDVVQLVLACLLLFVLTLALRLAAWGLGRLLDRRVLGSLDGNYLNWGERKVKLDEIDAFGYRYVPFARLFRCTPSGLRVWVGGEVLTLEHVPYWVRFALCFRCPNAHRRPTVGVWVLLGGAVLLGAGIAAVLYA